MLLEAWGSKNGSRWEDGFESLGDFFPGTHDSRCPGDTCGFFTPSFASRVKISGYNILFVGNDQYLLGSYSPLPNSTQQRFVPATVPQGFDGPESSCPKGFWDSHSDRFLLWFWVGPGSDGLFAKGWCGHNLLSCRPSPISSDDAPLSAGTECSPSRACSAW